MCFSRKLWKAGEATQKPKRNKPKNEAVVKKKNKITKEKNIRLDTTIILSRERYRSNYYNSVRIMKELKITYFAKEFKNYIFSQVVISLQCTKNKLLLLNTK